MKKDRIVIGVNCSGFIASACLVINGSIKYAIAEERISRLKQDRSFPLESIRYCCSAANISIDDITDIFVGWNPRYYLHKSNFMFDQAMQNRGLISHLALNELASMHGQSKKIEPIISNIKQQINSVNAQWNIHFVDHHKAHLSNAYFQSGLDTCDFIIADGFGESASGCVGVVDKIGINQIASNRTPHSLGLFYSTFTEFVGFRHNSEEWKMMALSALGDPKPYYDVIRSMININDITYEVDLSYFESFMYWTNQYYSPKLIELFGDPVEDATELGEREYNIVAAAQKVVEDVIFEILNNLYKKTGNVNLLVGGGFFMNSVLNGKIHERTPYQKVFIGGSPDDSGVSIGSALYGWQYVLENKCSQVQARHNNFGRVYSDKEIEHELKKRKIKYEEVTNPAPVAAQLLREKKIIGWFQGASEFGQRALGNRSILADPTFSDMKDIVNASVKYREGFRPFAPAVLKEEIPRLFDVTEENTAYFMEKVFRFKNEWKKKMPAVVHFDGTGRAHTVDKKVNKLFYELIQEFYKLSSCPVVLNTSFNINKMPLVETPGDAIDCFFQSGIDILIMHTYIIRKNG